MRAIPGFDAYSVTLCGRVFGPWHGGQREIYPFVVDGYPAVGMRHQSGRRVTRAVHRLVALVWIPNPHGYPLVRHLDSNRMNWRASNLAWGTHAMNRSDTRYARVGLLPQEAVARAAKSVAGHLTRDTGSYYTVDRQSDQQDNERRPTMIHTTAAHEAITATLDAALENRSWANQPFRTFNQFADAVAANLGHDYTREDAIHLCAILTAARDLRGNLATRISYAAHLARHAADNPLERGA